jgi:hypothetical protein
MMMYIVVRKKRTAAMIVDREERESRTKLIEELVRFFIDQDFEIHGVLGLEGYPKPPAIKNDGFGSGRSRQPDVIGFDHQGHRVVFGLARLDRRSLDSEDSLEEYNVFLDHNAGLKDQASRLYVMMPPRLVQHFTSFVTHYIHREYWHRIIPVGCRDT